MKKSERLHWVPMMIKECNQLIQWKHTYTEWINISYGRKKNWNILKKQNNTEMFNFDIKENNSKWSEIPDHPYRILIIGGSGSGKTNALLNLISHEPDMDKIYLYAKDPYEAKYQLLINKRENTSLK